MYCDARYSLACPRGKYLAALAASAVRTRVAAAITAAKIWVPMTYRGAFIILFPCLPLRQRFEGLAPLHPGDRAFISTSLVHCCFARATIAESPSRLSHRSRGFALRTRPPPRPSGFVENVSLGQTGSRLPFVRNYHLVFRALSANAIHAAARFTSLALTAEEDACCAKCIVSAAFPR